MKIKCCFCGKEIAPGRRPDGTPNGVGFQEKDGEIKAVCADCIIGEGKKTEKRRNDLSTQ